MNEELKFNEISTFDKAKYIKCKKSRLILWWLIKNECWLLVRYYYNYIHRRFLQGGKEF
jgi:hypothetical protein